MKSGRPRKYPFETLRVGERLVVPLDGRDAKRLANSLGNAAKHYAAHFAPGFRGRTEQGAGWVAFERLPDTGDRRVLVDSSRLARLDTLSRARPLTDRESNHLQRLVRREALREAA